jgi:hypothetical protein
VRLLSGAPPQPGRAVGGLLAGIVRVDAAAAGPGSAEMLPIFGALFLAAMLFQRVVPAT